MLTASEILQVFNQGNRGIASSSGETWEVQRKFTHRTLKNLSKNGRLEHILAEEVADLCTLLRSKAEEGRPVEIGFDINVAVANVTWAMVAGERSKKGEIRPFLEAVNKGIELASTSAVLLFMPFLAKIFPERYLGIDQVRTLQKQTQGLLQRVIDEHKANYQEDGDGGDENSRDFIDAFLAEMKREGAHESFEEIQLLILCIELFGAGGEPTSVTLKWAVRFLATNPEVQRRAQEEISRAVGQDRPVTPSDRPALPYVQALVYEIIRLADIHPIGVLHSPSADADIAGHDVPAGSFVFPNFHHALRDPDLWAHPDELRPEDHWLSHDGSPKKSHEGSHKGSHKEPTEFQGASRPGFVSFGVGRRKCPGQDMALTMLFVFVGNLIQNFEFSLAPGDSGRVECTQGVVVGPKPYKISIRTRF